MTTKRVPAGRNKLTDRLERECLSRLRGEEDDQAAVIAQTILEIATPLHNTRFRLSKDLRLAYREWSERTNLEVERVRRAIDLLGKISERQRRRVRSHRQGLSVSFPLTKAVLWEAAWDLLLSWKSDYLDAFDATDLLSPECGPNGKDEERKFDEIVGKIFKEPPILDTDLRRKRLTRMFLSPRFDRETAGKPALHFITNGLFHLMRNDERTDALVARFATPSEAS